MQRVYEVEIISTGDEIIFGQLVDTNASWIAKQSTEQGARVRRVSCVGDNVEDIVKAIEGGLLEARDLIVITGGLGPSNDDLTIEALAKVAGKKVFYDPRALKMLASNCRVALIDLTERRKKMARSVEGADPLDNSLGLAPGVKMSVGSTILVALPGIPKEMKPMFKRFVLPLIAETTFKRASAIKLQILMPYYSTFSILSKLRNLFPEVYIKTHSRPPNHEKEPAQMHGIRVDILVWGASEEECTTRREEVTSRLKELAETEGGRIIIETVESLGKSDDRFT